MLKPDKKHTCTSAEFKKFCEEYGLNINDFKAYGDPPGEYSMRFSEGFEGAFHRRVLELWLERRHGNPFTILENYRLRNGLTQHRIAKMIGVQREAYNRLRMTFTAVRRFVEEHREELEAERDHEQDPEIINT